MRRWSASEMPIPRSCTERIARSLRGLTRIVTGSPAVLQGVREEVRDDLVEAGPVPPPLGGLRLEDEGAPGPPRLVVEAVHHLAGDLREVRLLDLEIEPAGADARDVEQARDEPREPVDAPADEIRLARDLIERAAARGGAEAVRVEDERGERRLELVRGDGEELVARGHRLLRAAVQARGVDRCGEEPGEVLPEPDVLLPEARTWPGGEEHDRAERLAACEERDRQRGARAEITQRRPRLSGRARPTRPEPARHAGLTVVERRGDSEGRRLVAPDPAQSLRCAVREARVAVPRDPGRRARSIEEERSEERRVG